jgi:hypothetical protein
VPGILQYIVSCRRHYLQAAVAGTGTFLLLSPFGTGLADPDQREESFRIRIWPRLGEIFRPVENTPIFSNIKRLYFVLKYIP